MYEPTEGDGKLGCRMKEDPGVGMRWLASVRKEVTIGMPMQRFTPNNNLPISTTLC